MKRVRKKLTITKAISIRLGQSLAVMLLLFCSQTAARGPGQAQNNLSAAAKQASEEANRLSGEGSAASLRAAIAKHEEALRIYRQAGDRRNEAATLNNIAALHNSLSDRQTALQNYNQALSISRDLRDQTAEAQELNSIATVYRAMDELQKALEYCNQSLPIRRAAGDRKGEAATLMNIGGIYHDLGDNQKALEYYNQAAEILHQLGDRSRLAADLFSSTGSVYRTMGTMKKAVEFHQLALAIRKALGDRRGEATSLNNLGAAFYSVGDMPKALEFYNQALPIHKALGDRSGQATVLHNIGGAYYALGDKQKAMEYYGRALPMRRAVGDRLGEADTLGSLMELWTFGSARSPALAVFYGKQAVNVLQDLRGDITGLDKEIQKTFLKTKGVFYRGLAYLLMALGRLQEAQQVLNFFKDQQYFDFNRNLAKPPSHLTLTPREAQITEGYERTTARITSVARRLDDLTLKAGDRASPEETVLTQQLQAQLKTALDDFAALLKQAETTFAQANLEKEKVTEIPDTRELQNVLSELGRRTSQKAVAIYTFIGGERFCALVVTPDNIAVASQPIKADTLNQRALQLWGLLQSDKYDPRPIAQELYSIIFKPIEKELPKDTNTILWSLDGTLRYVPMAALYDGKQYLVERYNNVAFTRVDSERLLRRVSPRWTGLGFGSSEAHTVELLGDELIFNALPGVTEELRILFRQKGSSTGIIDGEVLRDASFTKASMLGALKQRRPLVHISSHFAFRPGDEARSFLLLGDGSAMTLEEMKRQTDLFSGVELLTLSACNTAAQRPGANGREIDGFAELA